MGDEYEGNYTIRRTWRRLIWVSGGALILIAFLMWEGPTSGSQLESEREVIGASGGVADIPAGRGTSGADPAIHELETITGALDGHELVGQRVDLHVDLASDPLPIDNGARFWIGPRDNRVLVVLRHDIGSLDAGRRYGISGTIQRLPSAEGMTGWALTPDDHGALTQRPVYIAATRAVPE